MSKKVVDVSMQVTCLEDDVDIVKEMFRALFNNPEVALVKRPRTGGCTIGPPKNIQPWMKECLTPEDC